MSQVSDPNVIEGVDLQSIDVAEQKRQELLRLFPEVRTEGGQIDFDRLKLTLGAAIDVGKERYGLTWPGKAECFRTIQAPSTATLRPMREESVNFDTTGNLLIEGDNLEVLKLLQKAYLGTIKMIYIDPPYNTGNDFIYPDNYTESLQTYLEYTGQVDAHGRKFASNTESDGRFHSKWLNMMYPRLFLARNLLRDDGVLFVSIDDHEVDNLQKMLDDIFGEENACATFVWNTEGNTDNQYAIKVNHEYVVAYYRDYLQADRAIGRVIDPSTRDDSNLRKGIADNNINKNNPANPPEILELPIGFPSSEESLSYPKKSVDDAFFAITRRDKYISDEVKAQYQIESLSGLPVKLDDMIVEHHRLARPCRIYGGVANRNKLLAFIASACQPIVDDDGQPLRFYINANAAVRYRRDNDKPQNILSVLRNLGTTERTRGYLKQLGIRYDYPKPVQLIEYLIKVGCETPDGIVMDFFTGSGTTAEALLNVNRSDHGSRRFICVQLPEPVDDPAFGNIARIARERVRKVMQEDTSAGFRTFSLAQSNLLAWNADTSARDIERQLSLHVHHLRPGRTDDDFLFEILLKEGFPLASRIETIAIATQQAQSLADGVLVICLSRALDLEAIRAIADRGPQRVVCLDEGFSGNDPLKANAVQIFKAKGIVFRTI